MRYYKKIIVTVPAVLCLAIGIIILMGQGNTLAVNECEEQTEQETSGQDTQESNPDEEIRQSMKKPVITKVTNQREGIRIKWKAVQNADGYRIERDGKFKKNITSPEDTVFLDKKAKKNGKKYKYVVYAYRILDGKKIKSEPSAVFTQYYLKTVKISEAARTENGDITITWTGNDKASGFQIQYADKKNFRSAQSTYARKSTAVSKKIAELQAGKGVYIRIRSYKKVKSKEQYSPWSAPVLLTGWSSKWKYAGNSKIHSGTAVLYYTNVSDKKNKTVCVNAGHGTLGGESQRTLCHPDGSPKVTGGTTAQGAVYSPSVSGGTTMADGTPEAEVNLMVAKLLKKKLLSDGYNVLMIRESSDVQLDNIARTVLANKYADCHIAVHFDSTASDKGAFVITVPNIASYRGMEPVASHWKQHNDLADKIVRGMKSEGVKIYGNGTSELDLTQTSYSTVPSVDVEVGDTRTSLAKKSLETIANGLEKGVDTYLTGK